MNDVDTICGGVPESRTCIVTLKVPGCVGVPLNTPAGEMVKPPGSVPPRNHDFAPVPPAAVNVCVYGTSTMPLATDAVVIASAGATVTNAVAVVTRCRRRWSCRCSCRCR